jgi:hypothetical protein
MINRIVVVSDKYYSNILRKPPFDINKFIKQSEDVEYDIIDTVPISSLREIFMGLEESKILKYDEEVSNKYNLYFDIVDTSNSRLHKYEHLCDILINKTKDKLFKPVKNIVFDANYRDILLNLIKPEENNIITLSFSSIKYKPNIKTDIVGENPIGYSQGQIDINNDDLSEILYNDSTSNIDEQMKKLNCELLITESNNYTPLLKLIEFTIKNISTPNIKQDIESLNDTLNSIRTMNICVYMDQVNSKKIYTIDNIHEIFDVVYHQIKSPDLFDDTIALYYLAIRKLYNLIEYIIFKEKLCKDISINRKWSRTIYTEVYNLKLTFPIIKDNIVTTMVQVQGMGDYLPVYSGNLDIINAAAVSIAEKYAKKLLGGAADV